MPRSSRLSAGGDTATSITGRAAGRDRLVLSRAAVAMAARSPLDASRSAAPTAASLNCAASCWRSWSIRAAAASAAARFAALLAALYAARPRQDGRGGGLGDGLLAGPRAGAPGCPGGPSGHLGRAGGGLTQAVAPDPPPVRRDFDPCQHASIVNSLSCSV